MLREWGWPFWVWLSLMGLCVWAFVALIDGSNEAEARCEQAGGVPVHVGYRSFEVLCLDPSVVRK